MKKRYILSTILLLFSSLKTVYAQLTVSMSATPAAVTGVVNICEDGSVIFTSTSQNVPVGATINWNFPGGSPASASTIGPHAVAYNTPGTYTATLTINGQSTNLTVVVAPDPGNPVFQITPFLTNFGYSQDTSLTTGAISIYYCGNQYGLYNSNNVQFQMTVGTYPADHQIIVNWGDGSSNVYAGDVGSVTHSYNCTSNNQFTASVSVVGPSGCVTAGTFEIYSGTAPQIFITNNLSTHCIPEPYDFTLNANDIPGSSYQYVFSDNNGAATPISGPFPVNLEYEFAIHSCTQTATIPGPGGAPLTYSNAYAASILATNLCGESFLSIGPIYVSAMPVADIDMPEYACVGEEVDIVNTSLLGMMVGPSGCNPLNQWYWTITPNSGYTINNGDLGDGTSPSWFFWTPGSETLNVTFNDYGTYAVQLIQANACGTDTLVDSICIVAPILADFTTNVISGCTPLEINTANLAYVPSCIQNEGVYNWNVASVGPGACPNEGALPNYTNGTDANSLQPSFLFQNPGVYQIQLQASLTNPIPGTLCEADYDTVEIVVSQGPNIAFQSYAVCEFEDITLNNTVEDCYAAFTDFEWTFNAPPASIATSIDQAPTLSFNQSGTFPISVLVTNECGSQSFNSNVIVHPNSLVTLNVPTGACVNNSIALEASISGAATQGQWSVSPPLGSFSNTTSLTPTYTPANNYTGPLVFTFTTTNAPAECGQVSESAVVVFEPSATANAGNYGSICQDNTLNLNGVIGGAASSLTWTSNSGGSFSDVNDANAIYTPPAGFTGTIQLTLTTDDPPGTCVAATSTVNITVVPPATINASAAASMCQGTSIPVTSTLGGTFTGVQWTATAGAFSNANLANTNFTPPSNFNGTIDLTATTTGSAPCPAESTTITITVEPAPSIANPTLIICSGESIDYTPSVLAPNIVPFNTQMTWNITPNPAITGATDQASIPSPNIAQTLVNSSNIPSTQIYTITPIVPSALNCVGAPFTLSVTVLPEPVVNTIADVNVCGLLPVSVTFGGLATSYSWTNSNIAIGLGASGIGDINFTGQNNTQNIVSGQIDVIPSYTSGGLTCNGNPTSFDISIIPSPVITAVNNQLVCAGAAIAPINFVSSLAGSTFEWTNTQTGIGLAANGTGAIPGFTAQNPGNALLPSTITVIAENNGCFGSPINFNINVVPVANVTNVVNQQTICSGATTSAVAWTSNVTGFPTTYAWSIQNNGGTITGFTANGTGNLPALTLLNNSGVSGELVITVLPTVNNCPGNSFTYTITVNPVPVFDPLPSQTICGGEIFTSTNFASNVAGTIFAWNLLDPGSVPSSITGYQNSGTGNIPGVAVLNGGSQPYTLIYQITSTANGCNGNSQTFQLIVNPSPEVTFSLGNQTVCSGDPSQEVIVSSPSPNVDITWTLNAVPPNTNGFNVSSGTTTIPSYILSQTSANPITAIFSAQATTTVGNACPGPIFNYTITINPVSTVDALPNQFYCNSDVTTAVAFTGTGTSYNWANNNPDNGLALSGVGTILPFTATNTTFQPINGLITVTPIYTLNNVSCPGTPGAFSILVNPSGQINSINDITSCNGAPVNPILFTTSNIGGSTDYSWSNDNPAIGLGSSDNNVTSIGSFIATNNLAIVDNAVITVTPTYNNAGLSCVGTPSQFNIFVIPTPTVDPMLDLVFCDNQTTGAINFSGIATNYQWTNDNTNIGLIASGSGNIPSFTATNQGLTTINGTVVVTTEYTLNGIICIGAPNDFEITVNIVPDVNPVTDITVCAGDNIPEVVFSGNSNFYTWSMVGDNIGSVFNGTGNLPTFTALNSTSGPASVVVTVIPGNIVNGYLCEGTPSTFNITVNPIPTVNSTDDITVCSNSAVNQVSFSGTATSYEWTTANASVGLTSSNGFDIINAFTSNNNGPITNISEIVVTPIFTNNNISCIGANDTFNIFVITNPIVNNINDQELCNGTPTVDVIFTGTATEYNWGNDNVNIGLTATGSGDILSFIATNSTLTPIVGDITITPAFVLNNVTCLGPTNNFTITVNPTPIVDALPDVVFCNLQNTNAINFTGNATTYDWTNNNTATGLNASGDTFVPGFVATNPTNFPIQSVVTVLPSFDGVSGACAGLPVDFIIMVNPTPQADPIVDQTICINTPSSEVTITGTGTSYNWTNDNIGIGAAASDVDVVTSFNGTNITNAPLTGLFTVTPIYTTANVSCPGPTIDFEITVLPLPIVNSVVDESLCNNTLFNGITYSGVFTETNWSNDNTSIGLSASGFGDLPSFTGINPSNALTASGLITVVPEYSLNGTTCLGSSISHVISVLPTTTVDPIVDFEYCNNTSTNDIIITSTGTDIAWNSSNPIIGVTSGTSFTIPSFIAINSSDVTINSTITVTPTFIDNIGTACVGTPESFVIEVHPSPIIDPIADYTICNDGTVSQFLNTNLPSTVEWIASTNPNVSGASTTLQNTNLIDNTLNNSSLSPQQITYTAIATSTSNGCLSEPMSFVVNLMPDIVMLSPNSFEICTGTSVSNVFAANVPSTFQWFGTANPNVTGVTTNITTSGAITDTPINNTTIPQLVIYTVVPTSDDGACIGDIQIISVLVTPPPQLISSPTASVCSEQAVNYNFVANTNGTFTWYGVNNANVTGISLLQQQGTSITDVLVNNTGIPQTVTYFVTVTSSASNCTSPSIPVLVTVNPLPVVQPLTLELCTGSQFTFNLEASEPSNFQWIATNNINVNGESLTLQNSNNIVNTLNNTSFDPQNVFYNVIPTSQATGCVGLMVQHTALVNPLPYLNFTLPNLLCSSNEIPITNNSATPLNVIWDFGNNTQSIDFNPTTFYETEGNYLITLYGINPLTGCENTIIVPVNIQDAPPVDFSVNVTEGCIPALFEFQNTAENPGSTLQWDFGDDVISNEQGTTDHFYTTAGCYDVTLTATGPNGCPNSITYEDMVCAYDIPIAGFIVNDPIQYSDVNEFIFENLTVFGSTYFWDFGDGTTTNAVHPAHSYPIERNIYQVMLVAYNEAGCTDTTYLSIQVQERLIFYVPNTFTPDGNTRNEEFKPIFTAGYDRYTYEFAIFNRWGEILFESYNDEDGWDGTYGGNVMQDGTYTWRIRFKPLDDDNYQEYYGHVNLLR
jgi:gliding motility-associated-like protein